MDFLIVKKPLLANNETGKLGTYVQFKVQFPGKLSDMYIMET